MINANLLFIGETQTTYSGLRLVFTKWSLNDLYTRNDTDISNNINRDFKRLTDVDYNNFNNNSNSGLDKDNKYIFNNYEARTMNPADEKQFFYETLDTNIIHKDLSIINDIIDFNEKCNTKKELINEEKDYCNKITIKINKENELIKKKTYLDNS